MREPSLDDVLARAEDAVRAGRGLGGTGFWKAVDRLRARPDEAAHYAERVAAIDRAAFELGVRLRVPAALGALALSAATAAGIAAIVGAGRVHGAWRTLLFLAGFGVLTVATHSLVHWAVGRLLGIRFTHYFLGGPPPPRPGAKVDYASYLLVPAGRRAIMHASGAVATKVLPFALIPVAHSLRLGGWVVVLLLAVGVAQILTDVVFSTRSSDWKRVRRELRARRV